MAQGILCEPSIKDWLEKRRKASKNLTEAGQFGETQRWLEERRTFAFYTSSHPHSCEHCRSIIIDLEDTKQKHKLKLPYNLVESVSAARGGCALYQSFVDSVFTNTNEDTRAAWRGDAGPSFWIEYFPEELPYEGARLSFTTMAPSQDGTDHVLDSDGGLSVWTLEGNPASVDVSTQPYELDYQSSKSTAWGRNCIKYCQANHSGCTVPIDGVESMETINPDSIPSRLLRLYQDKDDILHVQIIGRNTEHPIPTLKVSHQGFAILSYCWGGAQPIQLTRETMKLASSYPIAMLPKTLADAAWFTHQLGLEYLWVDALCILQDDVDDKGREIPRMGQYYGDATVTICAASADTCFRGFLTTPPPAENPESYLFGPVELRAKTTRGELGAIQVFKEPDYFNSHREREPVVERGWTLQESLLSRRLLIFSSQHLYFACREANASCGGREPLPKSRVIGLYESRVPGINTISSLQRMYPAAGTWDKVVNEYTQRRLGCFEDKLPAISAMAASLVRMARDERAQELQYCAGLMLDLEGKDRGWKGEFLWAVTQLASPVAVPVPVPVPVPHHSSPSWSWASLQAPIRRWQATPDDFPDQDGIRLLHCSAPLADVRNPFGAVRGGLIKLVARTRLFSAIDRAGIHMLVTNKPILEDEWYDESSRSVLVFRPDSAEIDDMLARGGRGVLLLELVAARTKRIGATYPAGLLVMECSGNAEEDGYYKRVGMFEFKVSDTSGSKAQQESAIKQAFILFNNCELHEVRIV
ncbi:HET-domain-containing protein [Xylaria cf. heliscus]|nr:HET-domain-containing protein [Xylaria cf. heliscus]